MITPILSALLVESDERLKALARDVVSGNATEEQLKIAIVRSGAVAKEHRRVTQILAAVRENWDDYSAGVGGPRTMKIPRGFRSGVRITELGRYLGWRRSKIQKYMRGMKVALNPSYLGGRLDSDVPAVQRYLDGVGTAADLKVVIDLDARAVFNKALWLTLTSESAGRIERDIRDFSYNTDRLIQLLNKAHTQLKTAIEKIVVSLVGVNPSTLIRDTMKEFNVLHKSVTERNRRPGRPGYRAEMHRDRFDPIAKYVKTAANRALKAKGSKQIEMLENWDDIIIGYINELYDAYRRLFVQAMAGADDNYDIFADALSDAEYDSGYLRQYAKTFIRSWRVKRRLLVKEFGADLGKLRIMHAVR